MKKNIFILLVCISYTTFSQSITALKTSALTQAKNLAEATIDKKKSVLLQYTHPVIRDTYGDQALLEAMEETFRTMAAQQIAITTYDIHEVVTVKKEDNAYRCLVTNTTYMDFDGRKITLKSSLLGFYDDSETQWYFIEANKLLADPNTQQLFPDFKTTIQIPDDEQLMEE